MTATALPIVFFLMIFLCMASSLAFVVLMAIWLYKDSRLHGQDPVLWVLICIFASPIIALILYLAFGRKQTLLPCQSCQQPIPHTAQYCEHCGAANEQYGQPLPRRKMNGLLKGAIATGAVSILSVVFMFVALFAFAMNAGGGSQTTNSTSAHPWRILHRKQWLGTDERRKPQRGRVEFQPEQIQQRLPPGLHCHAG